MSSIITAALALALPAQAADLMAHYPVVETSGSTVSEVDGWAPDAMLSGGARIGAGVEDQGVWFLTPDAKMRVPADDALEPSSGSIELWIQPSTLKNADIFYLTSDTLVRTGGDPKNRAVYGLRLLEDGSIRAMLLNDDVVNDVRWTYLDSDEPVVEPERWTHVALSWCKETAWLVVDGVAVDEAQYLGIPDLGLSYGNSTGLQVGKSSVWGSSDFGDREYLGGIDELKVHDGCRAPAHIAADLD